MNISSKENQINEEIREKEVRVIDTDGSQLGIMPTSQALNIAAEKKLDLVNIAPSAKPPVCKILDYGKYRYELQKKEKEARKKQKITQIKEIRVSTFIEGHDLQVKAKNAAKFLRDGDKVKVSLRFKGREKGYASVGQQVMEQFAQDISEVGVVEKKPQLEREHLKLINNAIAKLAVSKGLYYVDLWEVMADENGYLRADLAGSDGLHLLDGSKYRPWLDYLAAHTIYSAHNAQFALADGGAYR